MKELKLVGHDEIEMLVLIELLFMAAQEKKKIA